MKPFILPLPPGLNLPLPLPPILQSFPPSHPIDFLNGPLPCCGFTPASSKFHSVILILANVYSWRCLFMTDVLRGRLEAKWWAGPRGCEGAESVYTHKHTQHTCTRTKHMCACMHTHVQRFYTPPTKKAFLVTYKERRFVHETPVSIPHWGFLLFKEKILVCCRCQNMPDPHLSAVFIMSWQMHTHDTREAVLLSLLSPTRCFCMCTRVQRWTMRRKSLRVG